MLVISFCLTQSVIVTGSEFVIYEALKVYKIEP